MLRKIAVGSLTLALLLALIIGQRTLVRFEYAWHDTAQGRDVPVEVWASWGTLAKAQLGAAPRFAILNHGNTVRHDEYRAAGRVLAEHGYLVASIQHDLPGDPPLPQSGSPYRGRLPLYQRGVRNIFLVVGELQRQFPGADLGMFTLVGHSNGGDIATYFASEHPQLVERLITMDNLRVPLTLVRNIPVLSIRSNDWKPDDGVVPHDDACEELGIHLVKTNFQHVEFSDRGPDFVKQHVGDALRRFLAETPGQGRPGKIVLVEHARPGAGLTR